MRITHTSIIVEDQAHALDFYTDVLGFVKKTDLDMGEARWLTVTAADSPDGVELVLEPNALPAAKAFQQALLAQGIPLTMFASADVAAEVARLKERGVVFRSEPKEGQQPALAMFEDTCGNLIQLYEG